MWRAEFRGKDERTLVNGDILYVKNMAHLGQVEKIVLFLNKKNSSAEVITIYESDQYKPLELTFFCNLYITS